MEHVASVKGLSRRYGNIVALDNVDLQIPRGCVFGLLGENGAGKTTLIHHLLGLLKAESGHVEVLGLDPALHPAEVLGQLGVVSEDRDLPPWMKLHELLRYSRSFYPAWDAGYADELRELFKLDLNARVNTLSQGQLAKTALLLALAHRPALLILDEPSSGLDPVVRHEILEVIIATVGQEGRTVLFSSHLLDEVERIADHVAIMRAGKIVVNAPLDDIKETHYRYIVRGSVERPTFKGMLACQGSGPEWTVLCSGQPDALRMAIELARLSVIDVAPATLGEIFLACVTRTPLHAVEV